MVNPLTPSFPFLQGTPQQGNRLVQRFLGGVAQAGGGCPGRERARQRECWRWQGGEGERAAEDGEGAHHLGELAAARHRPEEHQGLLLSVVAVVAGLGVAVVVVVRWSWCCYRCR